MSALERKRPETCLSDLTLDRYVAGELLSERARDHLCRCTACSARATEIQTEAASFPRIPGDVEALARRSSKAIRVRVLFRTASAGVALAAAAVLLLSVAHREPSGQRAKGADVALAVFVRHANAEVDQLAPGGKVSPGESIRFAVTTRRSGHVKVFGIDQAQAITPYAPLGSGMTQVSRGRDLLLDGSIILDETLGPERLVVLLCPDPVDFAAVERVAARALRAADGDPRKVGRLDLPCSQGTLMLEKVVGGR